MAQPAGSTGSDGHVVAVGAFLAVLGAWVLQLRKRPSGFRVLMRTARSEKMLGTAMAAQGLCVLLLLAADLVPDRLTGAVPGWAAIMCWSV